MSHFRRPVVRSAALLLGAAILVPALARAAPGCVDVSFYAVYRNMGYDHIVHLANHCDKPASCSVTTNVNPQRIDVALGPREELDVLTFRGSPARAFTPHVVCQDAK